MPAMNRIFGDFLALFLFLEFTISNAVSFNSYVTLRIGSAQRPYGRASANSAYDRRHLSATEESTGGVSGCKADSLNSYRRVRYAFEGDSGS
jgi:hypothetical protein